MNSSCIRLVMAVALAFTLPQQLALAQDNDWEQVASSSDSTMYFDKKSFTATKLGARFELKMVYDPPVASPYRNYKIKYSVALTSVNCHYRSSLTLRDTSYGVDGSVVDQGSEDDDPMKYRAAKPGTAAGVMVDLACKRRGWTN